MKYVWIYEDMDFNHKVFASAQAAYDYCRKVLKETYSFVNGEGGFAQEAYDECLNELAHSYSESRNEFNVEDMFWVSREEVCS